MQAQGYSFKWKLTSTQAQAQISCNFYAIKVGLSNLATASYPGSLSFSSDDNREGREALGTRLVWPDIRPTSACATFCFHNFDGRRYSKEQLLLALRCFYAYVASFSRYELFYLHLCFHSCLCRW